MTAPATVAVVLSPTPAPSRPPATAPTAVPTPSLYLSSTSMFSNCAMVPSRSDWLAAVPPLPPIFDPTPRPLSATQPPYAPCPLQSARTENPAHERSGTRTRACLPGRILASPGTDGDCRCHCYQHRHLLPAAPYRESRRAHLDRLGRRPDQGRPQIPDADHLGGGRGLRPSDHARAQRRTDLRLCHSHP